MIALSRKGDGKALGELLESFRGLLLQRAASDWKSRPGARIGPDDLVQETLLRAVCRFSQFAGSSGPELASWLLRILESRIDKAQRELHAHQSPVPFENFLESEQIAAEQLSPGGEFRAREEQQLVEQAISWLTARYRKVIELRHQKDESFAEIGEALGCSEGAARKLWCRAIEQLRLLMGIKKPPS